MMCTKPYRLKYGDDGNDLFVPCGKCRACRIARSREWAIRIMHESDYHDNSVFLTLTYNDENLPENESIEIKAVQLFFKRLRKRLGEQKVKYFACGEYGGKTGRPHYHAIIFGIGPETMDTYVAGREKGRDILASKLIEKVWPFGQNYVGWVSYDSARYVADYIQKKVYGVNANRDGKKEPFATMSNGIGKKFVEDNKQYLMDNVGCTVKGVPGGLPKYYRKKLEIDTEVLREKKQELLDKQQEYYLKKYKNPEAAYKAAIKSRWQTDLNLKAKQNIKDDKV